MKAHLAVFALLATTATGFAQAPDQPAPAPPPAVAPPPAPAPAPAVSAGDARCNEALDDGDTGGCASLAAHVIANLRDAASTKGKNPNQPTITDTPGSQSSPGQTAAIASGQPVASGGGNLAAVGSTGDGLQLVTALAVNPATIVTGDTSSETLWLSRFADVSVLLPVNIAAADGTKSGFQYIGARLRINLIPALQQTSLQKELKSAVNAYRDYASKLSTMMPELVATLDGASDPGKCADAVQNGNADDQQTYCNTVFDGAAVTSATRSASSALDAFRAAADRKYLSIEGRFDRGDLIADDMTATDVLVAGYLAAGYASLPNSSGLSIGARVRGGVVGFRDGLTQTWHPAGYGALGAELALVHGLKRYALSVAIELYKHDDDLAMMPTMELENQLRIGLAVPVADGKSISVGVGFPTNGDDPIVAISGDWSLLLGK